MSRLIVLLLLSTLCSSTLAAVSLTVKGLAATISNDKVKIVFKESAIVSSVSVGGTNIASTSSKSFYLDWNNDDGQAYFDPSSITVVENTTSRAHFYWTQKSSSTTLHVEFHYLLEDGDSAIYSWAKYINDQDSSISLSQTRTVYRFNSSVLTQGTNQVRSGTLYLYSYLEKQTKIQDETWQLPDGTYYTKYDYAGYLRETDYQGVYGNGYGAFVISASREYHAGGPLTQDLLVHQDSLIANYFVSSHFGGQGLTAPSGWKHVYGPWLIYFPTGSESDMISNVSSRVQTEKGKWPYSFVSDSDYPTSRGAANGTVSGQTSATVVLYDSDSEKFDVQSLGYLYNTNTDSNGYWNITNIRPGSYKVVAYPIAGQESNRTANTTVTIIAGQTATVDTMNLTEPTNIIWSIGQADRRSDEYKYCDQQRNYLYETLSPKSLVYTVGSCKDEDDWYYAQAQPGVWTVQYEDTQDKGGRTLRVALAAASNKPHLIVTVNGHKIGDVYFGNDQAIYRSAIQSGTYYSNVFSITAKQVVAGTNNLTLQISKGQVMYDAISLQQN